jgi:hypothetical protein
MVSVSGILPGGAEVPMGLMKLARVFLQMLQEGTEPCESKYPSFGNKSC